jgi:predicted Fe-Mo cluster-binding NifX family protein
MRIAISAAASTPDREVDSRFGRAPWFLIHDTESGSWEAVSNQASIEALHGAGIQAAQTVARQGVNAVITGHCGPKAFQVLAAAGLKVFRGDARTVKEAVAAFQAGQLCELHESNGPDMGAP